jgi:hypothetical protein
MPYFFTSSGKEMPFQGPDDESVPLADYRKGETGQVLSSEKPFVVIGSSSTTGKTTEFQRWMDAGKVDLACGLDSLNVMMGKNRTAYADVLVVDEAGTSVEAERAFATIRQLRKLYGKIILATGGAGYTPTEQAAFLRQERIPPDIPDEDIETVLWHIKQLNRTQLQEMFRLQFEEYGDDVQPTQEQLQSMVDSIIPALRIPIVVYHTAKAIHESWRNDYYRQVMLHLAACPGIPRWNGNLPLRQVKQFVRYMNGERTEQ